MQLTMTVYSVATNLPPALFHRVLVAAAEARGATVIILPRYPRRVARKAAGKAARPAAGKRAGGRHVKAR